ncbi:MAG: hypothetical protein AB7E60_09070 [Sphingobium sp.]
MIRICIATLAPLVMTATAYAMPLYQPYGDDQQIGVGHGGTKLTEENFDYWTNGTPLGRFRVLGVINIPRNAPPPTGKALGPTEVAKLARQHGGDAIIALNRNRHVTIRTVDGKSHASFGDAYGAGFSVPVSRDYSSLAVIQYVPD